MGLLDVIINKGHFILAAITQASLHAYAYKTGHDIPSGLQNTVYAFYAFLGGHALTYQKYPDPPDGK
jgi:hypothetical protein